MGSVPNRPLRRTWRYFIGAWAIPIFAVAVAVAGDRGPVPGFIILLVYLLYLAAGLCYAIPYMRRQLSLRDVALFGLLAPFGIFVVAVIVKLLCTGK